MEKGIKAETVLYVLSKVSSYGYMAEGKMGVRVKIRKYEK